jgi:hypothetical protein
MILRPKKHGGSISGSLGRKGDNPTLTKEENRKRKLALLNPKYSGDMDIERQILIFEEEEGERSHYPDPTEMLYHLKGKKKKTIELSKALFKFGFSMDGRFYYLDTNGIASEKWGKDLDSLIDRQKILPRIYYGVLNLSADVWHQYELTKAEYEAWVGEEWSKSDRPGSGLYQAVQKRIQSYINRQPDYIRFISELSELKSVYAKLKGLLNMIYMQHYTGNIILSSKRANIGDTLGNTFAASFAAERDVNDESLNPLTSFDMEEEDSPDDLDEKKHRNKAKT